MIYSKVLKTNVPVKILKESKLVGDYGTITKYVIKDNKIPVGYVNIHYIPDGIEVMFLKNMYPNLYSGVGKIADQIEVEHCLNRGLKNFKIISSANFNSHALHFLRGKRFVSEAVNENVKSIIEKTPKGCAYDTTSIGRVAMYMPLELINKYVQKIKTSPILKRD